MQSPPAEWALAIGHLAVLDYLRSIGDADHDTISEVVRNAVARHPQGRAMFAAALMIGGIALHEHIVRPLRE